MAQEPANTQYRVDSRNGARPQGYQQPQYESPGETYNDGYLYPENNNQNPASDRYNGGPTGPQQPAAGYQEQQHGSQRIPNQQGPAGSQPPVVMNENGKQGSQITLGSGNIESVSQQGSRTRVSSEYERRDRAILQYKMNMVDDQMRGILAETEAIKKELKNEFDVKRELEKTLAEQEKEKKEIGGKLTALRVKLGVANANVNVGKAEMDQLRTKYQEAQIHRARLEERITSCNAELDRMRDPQNPESNVNMKKLVSNDRKEIRKLRSELEGTHNERDETLKHLNEKDMRIREVELLIAQAQEKKERLHGDLAVAMSHTKLEQQEREQIEAKYNALMEEKKEFDDKMRGIKDRIDRTTSGMTDMQKLAEEYRGRESTTKTKIEKLEKQLREVLTEIEQLKSHGHGMPVRIAGSIKDHQYRMSKGGKITDTAPMKNETGGKQGNSDTSATSGKANGKSNLTNFVPAPKQRGLQSKPKAR